MSPVIDLRDCRSVLFTPGSDRAKIEKALASAADIVVLDLEDAVLPRDKDAARTLVGEVLARRPPRTVAVRVNAGSDPDLELVAAARPDAVMIPKATPALVDDAAALLEGVPIIALVETAEGVYESRALAARPGVAALAFGNLDLSVELGLEPRDDELELLFPRAQLVLASAAAKLRAPLDGVHPDYRDLAGFERRAGFARSLGFGGKLCIHPAQVEVANAVFAPGPEAVVWAERVLAEVERAGGEVGGVISVEGSMVDLPVVERARRLLARARAFDA